MQCCQYAFGSRQEAVMPSDPKTVQSLLQRLHQEMRNLGDSPQQRHLAFMLLQFLGGKPTSLYKEPVEEAPQGGTANAHLVGTSSCLWCQYYTCQPG